jgi:YD repeat-containing protein
MGHNYRISSGIWPREHLLGPLTILIACVLTASLPVHALPPPLDNAQSVSPCMRDGKPCNDPGSETPGNNNFMIPSLGVYYNSMTGSSTGQRPGGFFGQSMSFPFGYLEVQAGIPFTVAPDGSRMRFVAQGAVFQSERAAVGDLSLLSSRGAGRGYDLLTPDGTRVAFTAAKDGNRFYPTEVKGVDGHALMTVEYDTPSGALFSVTDQNGFVSKFLPLSSDRTKVGEVIAPDGTKATLSYNSQGQLTKVTFAGSTTELSYDTAGNVTRLKVQTGTKTDSWDYYYKSGLLSDIMQGQDSTSFIYANDSVTAISGRSGKATSFARTVYTTVNGMQRVVRQEGGMGAPTQAATVMSRASYNSRGLITSFTDEMGRTTKYEYGTGPFATKVTNPDGSSDVYTYADAANAYRVNKVVTTGPDGKQASDTYTWSGPKLTALTRVVDGATVLNERYNSNATTQSVISTTTETYSYDRVGRLLAVRGPGGRVATTYTQGQVTSVSNNGVRYGMSSTISATGERSFSVSGPGISALTNSDFTGRSWETTVANGDATVRTTVSGTVSGSVLKSDASSKYEVTNGSFTKSGSSELSSSVGADGTVTRKGSTK